MSWLLSLYPAGFLSPDTHTQYTTSVWLSTREETADVVQNAGTSENQRRNDLRFTVNPMEGSDVQCKSQMSFHCLMGHRLFSRQRSM